ncbi:hypothetical protein D3C71_1795070 [compost metagenome]
MAALQADRDNNRRSQFKQNDHGEQLKRTNDFLSHKRLPPFLDRPLFFGWNVWLEPHSRTADISFNLEIKLPFGKCGTPIPLYLRPLFRMGPLQLVAQVKNIRLHLLRGLNRQPDFSRCLIRNPLLQRLQLILLA